MEQAIELLKQKANPSNVSDMASTSVVTIHSTRNTLFFQSETHDGGQIHVSLWGRNLLVLWQGNLIQYLFNSLLNKFKFLINFSIYFLWGYHQ